MVLDCWTRLGVTAAQRSLPVRLRSALCSGVRARTVHPFLRACAATHTCRWAVGFGISTPEHVAAVAKLADGVVVGSALVTKLEQEGVAELEPFVRALLAHAKHYEGGRRRPPGNI